MTRISVIIPVYNAAKTLARCLDSVLSQTISPFEIVTVNDGSVDSSINILNEYAGRYPQIHVISQANKGVSTARNVGINAATGEWILFVDADDYLASNTLEILTQNNHGGLSLAGLTIHLAERVYCQNLFRASQHIVADKMVDTGEALQSLNYYSFSGPVCKLFRTDIVKQNHIIFPADMQFGEDTIFLYTYLRHVKSITVHDAYPYHCDKSNEHSLTASVKSDAYYDSFSRIYSLMKDVYHSNSISMDYADYIYLDALQTATHFSYKDHMMDASRRISIYKEMFANEHFESIKPQCSFVFILLGSLRAWHLCDIYLKFRSNHF